MSIKYIESQDYHSIIIDEVLFDIEFNDHSEIEINEVGEIDLDDYQQGENTDEVLIINGGEYETLIVDDCKFTLTHHGHNCTSVEVEGEEDSRPFIDYGHNGTTPDDGDGYEPL